MKAFTFIRGGIRSLVCPVLFGLTVAVVSAQTPNKVIVSESDPFTLYNFDNDERLFYLELVPKTKPLGCLVILPSAGELVESAMSQISLHKLAVKKGLLVIFPSINWGLGTFEEEHKFLDIVFKQVSERHGISRDKFVIGGFSNGGMVSLSYAEKANASEGATYVVPKAVFALDPPVDLAHLYAHAQRDVERNFSPPAVREGNWLMDTYRKAFGGSPEEVPGQYVRYSIYSHDQKDGGNAKYLARTPLRIYTEPGIEWQLQNRGRDLYDLNCTDLSALINLLHTMGNTRAELIVTHDKGIRPDGSKHPHSWSIMDSEGCLVWIMEQLK